MILMSASKRREELLKKIIKDFKIVVPDIDENIDEENPVKFVKKLSKMKVLAVDIDDTCIAADTVVVFDNKILGKPKDKLEAINTLKMLSGKKHYVLTGVSIKKGKTIKTFYDRTDIEFRDLSENEIVDYVENMNPLDKAGSYGIQDSNFVKSYDGSYYNVVGLPIEKLKEELDKLDYTILEVKNLKKVYDKEVIFENISFKVSKGEIFSVIGKSGIGKSTIGKIIIGITKYDEGEILFDKKDLKERKIRDIQMIFQDPYSSLDETMNIYELLSEPLIVNKEKDIEKKVNEMLDILELSEYKYKYPKDLSGGQRQRVVVGEAMILRPKLIIADEPTSALDLTTQQKILDLILYFNKEYATTFIFISHDLDIVKEISTSIFRLIK
ncbi:Maf family nucleotide pyrophosphatase [Oceanivirga miroungae]|uniref:dTTP/UTP pyrophosphatase n=1 Tax=Oceanivirga miroungae TaxID=1130046 RepID=A0A6I8MEE6_9FUSO|nr:Maf family nucleotide pyrophosphatase [Oceanivirga miroungae]VWL85858.1 iron(III) ABC transporter, ATP-binding protein [Oceanivirga miroungae]